MVEPLEHVPRRLVESLVVSEDEEGTHERGEGTSKPEGGSLGRGGYLQG